MLKYVTLVGFLWIALGLFVAIRDWGDPKQIEWAVTMGAIGVFNVAIGLYLNRRFGRGPGARR